MSESELDGILADDDSGWITVNQTQVFVEHFPIYVDMRGNENFSVFNRVPSSLSATVNYSVDGYSATLSPGSGVSWSTNRREWITFDQDTRTTVTQWKTYDLSDQGVYYFRPNNYTRSNSRDIDLYRS